MTLSLASRFQSPRAASAIRAAALAGLAMAAIGAAPGRADGRIDVKVDEAKIIELPEKTSVVIVGNPIVVDITLLKGNNKVVLTGKGFGQTNLIALDSGGNVLGESNIHVKTGFTGLTVQRGLSRESYACEPRCQSTVVLGDTQGFMSEAAGQITAHGAFATTGGGGK